MSDKIPPIPKGLDLTQEQIDAISGGLTLSCTPAQLQEMLAGLKQNYETLIDFTSYVIERVAGGNP